MLSIYLSMLETEEEKAAFTDLYESYRHLCLNVALKITGSQAMAEDALHNAFLKMIRHKEKHFTNSCKRTASQIVIIVKSAAIDILRREKRLDHDLLDDLEPIIPNDEPDTLRIIASKEAVDRLQHHVSQLNEVNQSLFEMKYLSEKSDGEIANMLGLRKNTVAVRIHRLKSALFETMREEGYINDRDK